MVNRKQVGAEAESKAAKYVRELGWTILARNWHAPRSLGVSGELDIVALDGETVVFIEVRSRSGGKVDPESTISAGKQSNWIAAAQAFLAEFDMRDRQIRFDAIALTGSELRHHQGALDW